MDVRCASNPKDAKHYTTERLREEFHITGLFTKDNFKMVYSHIDRIITAGFMPVYQELKLEAGKELAAEYFLERREMGCINIGGKGIITVDGVDYVDSLQNWALWADASDPKCLIKSADGSSTLKLFNDYDADTKAKFFGLLEKTYMSFYATIPLYYRNTASMVSQKGDYCVTEYVDLIGFGGTQFYTFKYDDTAWEAVKGSLQY